MRVENQANKMNRDKNEYGVSVFISKLIRKNKMNKILDILIALILTIIFIVLGLKL